MHKLIFIDTETTGVDPAVHGIIQVAGICCTYDAIGGFTGKEEVFNLRARPFPEDVIDERALEVNGITLQQLNELPTPQEMYYKFVAILDRHIDKYNRRDKAYFVGYNAMFDYNMMRRFFEKSGNTFFGSYFFFPPIDVMQLASFALMDERPKMANFKLKTVAEALKVPLPENLHDAMADIEVTRGVFMALGR